MTALNNFLDNREMAIAIWLAVFFVWAISQRSIRESFISVIKALTQKVIFISTLLLVVYVGTMIYFFCFIGLWKLSFLGDTIVWLLGVAFVMFININEFTQDDHLKKAVLDNLKFAVFLEFVVNLYVFDFWIELILVPCLVVIGVLLGVSTTNPENKPIESCLTKIVTIIGLGFIIFALYNIIFDFQGFASINNLKEFFLPLVLTVGFLPYIYLLALYITYNQIFQRLKHLIKSSSLAKYTKRKTVIAFHLNLKALNKWSRKIVLLEFDSKEDIARAIFEIKQGA